MTMRRLLAVLSAAAILAAIGPVVARAASSEPARIDDLLVTQMASASSAEPLPVFVHGVTIDAAVAGSEAAGLQVVDRFDRVGVAVAVGTPAAIAVAAHRPGVTFLEADRPVSFDLDTSQTATRGTEARTAFLGATGGTEIDGSGVGIAVIDSGIDGTHPMFQDGDGTSRVARNLKLSCHNAMDLVLGCHGPQGDADEAFWLDVPGNDSDTATAGGHGTHVAGIAAGGDVVGADGTAFHGSAPGATIVGLSVGAGVSIYGHTAALNWVLEHHSDPCGDGTCEAVKVVNLSISASGEYDPEALVAKLQHALVADGVVVVWSAGNFGGDGSEATVNGQKRSPVPGVLVVANYDDGGTGTRDGAIASTSSKGAIGQVDTYPDVAAPGSLITSACRYTLAICRSNGDVADPDYAAISGTSMAAPHVAGIVAQLLQVNPDLTPAQVEDILEDTAYQFGDPSTYVADDPARNDDHTTSFDKGHGLVDATAAVAEALSVTAPPGPSCTGDALFLDARGDATAFVVETGAPSAVSEDGLDVVWGNVARDAAGDLVFTVAFEDLKELGPAASNGEYIRFYFTYSGIEFYLSMQRSLGPEPVGITDFRVRRYIDAATTDILATGLAGSFDPASDTVSATVPAATFEGYQGRTAVGEGDIISGLRVLAQRYVGVATSVRSSGATPSADTANGPCPYVVGA